jgi:hypothetical protein
MTRSKQSKQRYVRFEVFTAMTMKSAIFWDVAAECSHLLTLVPRARMFLPWRWKRYVPPNRRFTQDLHSATPQKTAFFINRGSLIGNFGYVDCIFRLLLLLMAVSFLPQEFISAILAEDTGNWYQLLCGYKGAPTKRNSVIRFISWCFFVTMYAIISHLAYSVGNFGIPWRHMVEFNKYLKIFVPLIKIPSLNEGKIVSLISWNWTSHGLKIIQLVDVCSPPYCTYYLVLSSYTCSYGYM